MFHPLIAWACCQGSEIIVESLEDPTNCDDDWKFALWELAGSHYAAICTKRDRAVKGEIKIFLLIYGNVKAHKCLKNGLFNL